jgi:hypothetical protein
VVRAGKGFRADRASRTHYSPQPQPWESGASRARGNKVQDQYQRRPSGGSACLLVSVMLEWVVLGRTNCRKFQGESWGRCSDYATRPAAAGCTGLTNTSPCADCADQSGRAEQHADSGRGKQATVGEGKCSAGEPSGGMDGRLAETDPRDGRDAGK